MPAVEIRPAAATDVAELARLLQAYRAFYHVTSGLAECGEFLRARITRGESTIFVAQASVGVTAELCGFAQLYPTFSSLRGSRAWILNDLFVQPRLRRCGIGRRLLRRAADHARSTGAGYVVLATQRTNVIAKTLYESDGYVMDHEFDHYELRLAPSISHGDADLRASARRPVG